MQLKPFFFVALSTVMLAACGGGGGDDEPRYESLVSFGDSLSDVGSYKTAGVAALGGGKYTVNGPDGLVWVEQLARKLDLPAPCAAQTGLQASGPFAALAGAVVNHPNCTAYGQGGSQVNTAIGPWNAGFLQSTDPDLRSTGQLGQLTMPATEQVKHHLAAHGGRFSGHELVTVLAGANDVFVNLEMVGRGLQTPTAAVTAMATAGAQLATLVKEQIVAKGATRVLVMNLPNISHTPAVTAIEQGAPGTQQLADGLTQAFNAQLGVGLQGTTGNVAQIDLYAQNSDQIANPSKHGLRNVTTPVCTNSFFGIDAFLAPSLLCTTSTTRSGDVSHDLFADGIHPTPYGHQLLRDMALRALKDNGWD